jgi:hypothetical protein
MCRADEFTTNSGAADVGKARPRLLNKASRTNPSTTPRLGKFTVMTYMIESNRKLFSAPVK